MARTSNLVRSISWNTRRLPSGDQRGRTWTIASDTSVVACCGFWPSASVIQMRRGPAHEASTASRRPSGENDGLKALSMSRASLRVATSTAHTSPPSY